MSATSPIFIGGMYKSGTSLLRALIGQHQDIASDLETYWFDLDGADPDAPETREAIARWARFFDRDSDELLKLYRRASSIRDVLDDLLGTVARRMGKQRWAEKTPGNIVHVPRILELWPDARILHIVRDPRDIFASLVRADKWSTAQEFGERWTTMLGAAEQLSPCQNRSVLEIVYERLVLDTEAQMREVIEFLGAQWDPAASVFQGKNDDFQRVLEVTGKSSTTLQQLSQPLTDARIGLWHQTLSDDQLISIREYARRSGLESTMQRIENACETAIAEAGNK